jgi:hypothetical protein
MKRLLAVLFSLMSSAALAQTTGTANPGAAPAQPPVNEDVPSGGCMPIGLTASGEIVFPIQCKELIDRHRGAVAEQKPAAVDEKPAAAAEEKPAAVEDKPAAKQSEAAPQDSEPVTRPVETVPSPVPSPKRVELRDHAASSGDCSHYRSFDRISKTYRSYDGQIRPCRMTSR